MVEDFASFSSFSAWTTFACSCIPIGPPIPVFVYFSSGIVVNNVFISDIWHLNFTEYCVLTEFGFLAVVCDGAVQYQYLSFFFNNCRGVYLFLCCAVCNLQFTATISMILLEILGLPLWLHTWCSNEVPRKTTRSVPERIYGSTFPLILVPSIIFLCACLVRTKQKYGATLIR